MIGLSVKYKIPNMQYERAMVCYPKTILEFEKRMENIG